MRRLPARMVGAIAAGGAIGLVLAVYVSGVFGSSSGAGSPPGVASAASEIVMFIVPSRTPATPIDLAAVYATSDALFTRTPGVRPPQPTAAGGAAPASTTAAATSLSASTPAPVASKPGAPTPAPVLTKPGAPTPEATETPTVTPTKTATPTVTQTPTMTPTPTPTPAPCEIGVPVPRLTVGNGYYVTFTQDGFGPVIALWDLSGGRILLYANPSSFFGPDPNGVKTGVPPDQTVAGRSSGRDALTVAERPAGPHAAYFFNPSVEPIGPALAQITYLKIGPCS